MEFSAFIREKIAGLGVKLAATASPIGSAEMGSSPTLPSLTRKGKKISKVWISPADWKRMNPEKQAILVALWHDYEDYDQSFPFEKMYSKKKQTVGVITLTSEGEEGLTFYFYGKDLKKAGLVESFKEFKIPHTLELEAHRDGHEDDKVEAVKG